MHEIVVQRLAAIPGNPVRFGAHVVAVEPHAAVLASGERIPGKLVVDSRGPLHTSPGTAGGYQKFVGLELMLAEPIRRTVPS